MTAMQAMKAMQTLPEKKTGKVGMMTRSNFLDLIKQNVGQSGLSPNLPQTLGANG